MRENPPTKVERGRMGNNSQGRLFSIDYAGRTRHTSYRYAEVLLCWATQFTGKVDSTKAVQSFIPPSLDMVKGSFIQEFPVRVLLHKMEHSQWHLREILYRKSSNVNFDSALVVLKIPFGWRGGPGG